MSQRRTFKVTLSGTLSATNPIEAAHLFTQLAGRPGFDKFQVVNESGETNIVDIGLLINMGVLKFDQPEASEAVEEVNGE